MAYGHSRRRDRAIAVVCAAALQALLLYALVAGLAVRLPGVVDEGLALFRVTPPSPPAERIVPQPQQTPRREGAASPRNLRAQATAIVAPPPIVPVPLPPPVVAAPVAGLGADAAQGASDLPGPGTGSGGQGDGRGSGGRGDGDGFGDETPPRWRSGRIRDADYPRAAAEAGASGTVSVRYRIELDGHVSGCVIMRSSGNAELDETTCRLIERRFRYEPSRDAAGRPVIAYIVRDNDWVIEREPADPRGG